MNDDELTPEQRKALAKALKDSKPLASKDDLKLNPPEGSKFPFLIPPGGPASVRKGYRQPEMPKDQDPFKWG